MLKIEDLRRALQLPPDNDGELELIREEVVSLWESTTGRLWNIREDHVEEFSLLKNDDSIIWLNLWPIDAVSLVEVREITQSAYSELAADQYVIGPENRLRRLNNFWTPNVKVTYDGGYDEDTCPPDVRNVLLLQARFMKERHSNERIFAKGSSMQGGSTQFYEEAYLHPTFKRLASIMKRKA